MNDENEAGGTLVTFLLSVVFFEENMLRHWRIPGDTRYK